MKKIIFTTFSFCLLLSQTIFGQSYSGAESVEFDYAYNRYLVSNTTSKKIIARAPNGTLSVFATCATAPYGIEIFGDTLYCCTGNNLRGINLNTGVQIFVQQIGSGAFLNGITHDPAGNLYITGFTSKKVYRFNTATRQSNIFVDDTGLAPNGIIYDSYDGINPRLVMVSWTSSPNIQSVSLIDSSLNLLTNPPFGNIDGIAKGKNGYFYISCWSNNSIQRYDSTFTNPATAMVTSGLSSPADIFYNHLSDTLAVPFGSSGSSNVNFYYFGSPTVQKTIVGNLDINLYPNPTNGIININGLKNESKHISIDLFEIGSGKLVFSQNITNSDENMSINLKDHQISSGLYFIEISSEDGIISRKKLTIN